MKIRYNENQEIVDSVKQGLKRTGGYCPCRLARTEENKCMCKEFRNRSRIRTLKAIATVCCTTRKNKASSTYSHTRLRRAFAASCPST